MGCTRERGAAMSRSSLVTGLLVLGVVLLGAALAGCGASQEVALGDRPGSRNPVEQVSRECPDELTAQAPAPIGAAGGGVRLEPGHVPDGYTLVTRYLEHRSFATSWAPPVPVELEGELTPHVDDVKLYARGDWSEADSYFVLVPLRTSRALGCYLLRTAAAEDRAADPNATGPDDDASEHWRPPPTRAPAEPRAQVVDLRGGTAVLTPGEPPTNLTRLMWMEGDDVLVQVLAERMAAQDVLAVAEQLVVLGP